MKKITVILMWFVALILPSGLSGQNKKEFSWMKTQDSLTLFQETGNGGRQVVWQFNYFPDRRTFFHPVFSPDGTLLTAEAPKDHPWHLGLWFCWKYINGLNYWEYSGDSKLAVSEGKTDLQQIRISTRRDGSGLIKLEIIYHPWDSADSVVMKETRTIRAAAPEADGSYSLDFEHKFTAVTDLLLERTPPQTSPGGVTWGGYAGLSVRFDQKLSDPNYFSSELDSMVSGTRTGWVAANLKNGKGKTVQMVILENISNTRYPTPWYCINRPAEKFWYYNAAILYHEGLKMKKGETLTLGYKVLVPASPLTRTEIADRLLP